MMEGTPLSSVLGTLVLQRKKMGFPRAQCLEDTAAGSEVRDVAGTRLSGTKSLSLLSSRDCYLLITFLYSYATFAFLLSLLTAF